MKVKGKIVYLIGFFSSILILTPHLYTISLDQLTIKNNFITNGGTITGSTLTTTGLWRLNSIQYVTPTTGGTTTVASTTTVLIFNASSNYTQTIALPSSPVNGQMLIIVTGPSEMTTLTFTGGTVINAPTKLTSGNQTSRSVQLIYNSSDTSWYVISYAV